MSTISMSSPTMSDKTLLLSVEDLISIAMGPREGNTVNFKMIQTILHILARQMRVLEQKVVLVTGELPEKRSPSRGRRRSSKGGADRAYRRPTPPEFKSEEERIAWEKEQDEIELRQRSRSKSQTRRGRRGSVLSDEDEEARPGEGGKGRRRSSTARRDDEAGRARSGSIARGGYDDDREGRGGTGRRGADRYGEEKGGRDRPGGQGADAYDERRRRGTSTGGREDDEESSDRSAGSDRDEARRGRGRSVGPGGQYSDDDVAGGRGRSGGRKDGYDEKTGRRITSGGLEGEDDDGLERGGRGGRGGKGRDEQGRGREDAQGGERGAGARGTGAKGESDEAQRGGKQGVGVREIDGPGKEKLLIVEKGPTTVGPPRDRDSIAVVTQSQFQLLAAQVEELLHAAGPLPPLTMPDNEQLRQDLAAGASLTDAMQAMQVSARVQAAEQAIMKLGALLTQLAASGALPPDAAGAVMAGGWTGEEDVRNMSQVSARVQAAEQAIMKLGALLTQLAASGALPPDAAGAVMAGGWTGEEDALLLKSTSSGTAYKSIQIDPSAKTTPGMSTKTGGTRASSKESIQQPGKFVTKPEMGTALTKLREDVTKTLQTQIDKAATAAETAEKTAKTVGDKVEELMKMDTRLTALHSMVEDYTEQLNGFDAGLTTQMDSFKEQMTTMRAELQGGLEQLEVGNSNPETAAVMELNERFEGLVRGLDDTLLQHTALSNMQHQLTQELKTLVEGVEMLREQKADRDELLDILRDKADISMLEGLVRQEEFERAQEDLERRLEQCNDKFKRQDEVWMGAMGDLRELADTKAQLTDLLKIRDEATMQLQSIDDRINRLALILGEPQAALLMRKLARDAVCGACLAPAMMQPGRPPQPPALPAAAPAPAPAPCAPEPAPPGYPDFSGRSVNTGHVFCPPERTAATAGWAVPHTLLPPGRIRATPIELPDVTKKYAGYGDDGRLYRMETPMEACVECNPEPAPAPPGTARSVAGAGDGAGGDNCEC